MADYIDLLITDDDITLDVGRQPVMTTDRACIAQDIMHMIRDTGILVEIIAERNEIKRKTNLIRLTLEVETDERIVPGSTRVVEDTPGHYWLHATTVDYGDISFRLEA